MMGRIASLLALLLMLADSAHASPPNVVLILADDQASSEYGFMGHEELRTPRLDRLVAESRLFTRGHLVSDQSRSNLVSLLTGLYPHQHGIVSDVPPIPKELEGLSHELRSTDPRWTANRNAYIAHLDVVQSIASQLAGAGYIGFQAGRWWEGEHSRAGFSHGLARGEIADMGALDGTGLPSGRSHVKPVLDFMQLAQQQGKPFFILYAPMMPKPPHRPLKRLLSHYSGLTKDRKLAYHWAMCESFDEGVGKLLGKVESLGLAPQTLVIFLGDAAGHPESSPEYRRAGIGGVTTPLALRWPGHALPGRDDERNVSVIDVAPTILAAAGLMPEVPLPGIDLLDPKAVAARKTIYGASYEPVALSLENPAASLRSRWLIDEEWKLILPFRERFKRQKPELYNLSGKARKKKNLARARPPLLERLTRKLDAWWTPELGDGED